MPKGYRMIHLPNLESFLRQVYAPHRLSIKPATIDQYGYTCRSIERFYSRPILIGDLTDDLVLPWLQRRLQQVSPKSVKRERGDLLTLWRWAVRHGHNVTPPVDVPTIPVPRKPVATWRVEDFERLIVACRQLTGEMRGTGIRKAAWWASLMITLYWLGSRLSATLAIRSDDIDLERRFVVLRGDVAKTGEMQILNLHDQAVAAIAGLYCPHRTLVWPYPYNARQIWPQLKAILRKAGLPNGRYWMFGCVRHTCFTLATKHGSQELAARQLGHRSDMSRYYLDARQLEEQQAAQVLPRLHIPDDRQMRLFV